VKTSRVIYLKSYLLFKSYYDIKNRLDIMVKFCETNAINKDFEDAIKIYIDSFPANERHSVDVIKERLIKKKNIMYIGRLENEIVFIALLWPLLNTDFILFDYMAVKESHRNKGIGTNFIKYIEKQLEGKNKHLILEVENPNYGDNKEEKMKRIKFYKRQGVKEMKNVAYILPPLSGPNPTEMILMILPDYDAGKIPGKLVKKTIKQIYKELYNRDKDDLLLNSFIHDVPHTVELI